MTAHFFMEDPYAEALRKNAINHTLNGQLNSPLTEGTSLSQLTMTNNNPSQTSIAANSSALLDAQLLSPLADASLLLAYQTANGTCSSIASDSINKPPTLQVPPMPPLRSTAHLLQDESNAVNHHLLFGHHSHLHSHPHHHQQQQQHLTQMHSSSNPFATFSRTSLASSPTSPHNNMAAGNCSTLPNQNGLGHLV